MRLKSVSLFSVLFILTACSFNRMFLYPTVVPESKRTLTETTALDTTVVQFTGETFQPVFLDPTDTIHFDFTIESFVFESTSGNKLNGWLLKQKNSTPDITLLHFHGNAGFLLSQYQAMSPLLAHGYQIFLFDYSGFGFSEGKATRNNVLKDANSALTYVKTRPELSGTKLVIYGQSLGGHLSAVVAAQRQEEIDGLVIEAAFSSHKDIAAATAGFLGRIAVSEKYSATESIREFHKPVLVIHSKEDDVIPAEMGRKLFENANEPKEYYEIGHCHICGPTYFADSIAGKIRTMVESSQ